MSRKPAKTRHSSTTKPKRNNTPTATRQASSTLADLQEQVSALTGELAEALEQQTATAEILRVISGFPNDTQPVFEAIVRSGLRLFANACMTIALPDGDLVQAAAVAD